MMFVKSYGWNEEPQHLNLFSYAVQLYMFSYYIENCTIGYINQEYYLVKRDIGCKVATILLSSEYW